MVWADLAILLIVAISAVVSLFRGLVREVLSLVAWVLAFWVGLTFSSDFAAVFKSYVAVPWAQQVLAFLTLFLVVLLLVGLMNYLVGKFIDATGLTSTDRVLGAAFGMARGLAVAGVLALLAGHTPLVESSWWRQSMLLPDLYRFADSLTVYIPDSDAAVATPDGGAAPKQAR